MILYKGYFIFGSWILDQLQLNINNILTASSLAHQYLKKQHCYGDVYEFNGIIHIFIKRCVIGGCVMTAKNKKRA